MNMNRDSTISHAKRACLLTVKLILIFTAILSAGASAQAQSPVDLKLYSSPITPIVRLGSGQDIRFQVFVKKSSKSDATGVTVTAVLPAGTAFSSVRTDTGTCRYADNLITCELGDFSGMSIDYDAVIEINLKPTAVGTVVLTAQVMGRETDPNLSNNTLTATVTINPPKSRKRVRFF